MSKNTNTLAVATQVPGKTVSLLPQAILKKKSWDV